MVEGIQIALNNLYTFFLFVELFLFSRPFDTISDSIPQTLAPSAPPVFPPPLTIPAEKKWQNNLRHAPAFTLSRLMSTIH